MSHIDEEKWVPLFGWDGLYEISNYGQVKSIVRVGRTRLGERKYGGGMLSHIKNGRGYAQVNLIGNGKRKAMLVHRAVLLSFIGEPLDGQEGCHGNGDKMDCKLSNLRWDTKSGNNADKVKHGTWQGGENNPNSRITKQDVLRIRACSGTVELRKVAMEIGISASGAEKVKYRKTWAHVKD